MPRWSAPFRARSGEENRAGGVIRAYLPEIVYGATDGIVTTFAIVSGVVGAALSVQTVLVLGFASLLADGFSMAVSNVLSERSKIEDPPTLREAARKGWATFCGFMLLGVLPLLAYVLPEMAVPRFTLAAMLAAGALFAVGAARSWFTRRPAFRAGLEMLALGVAAGALAYAVGRFGAYLTGGALG